LDLLAGAEVAAEIRVQLTAAAAKRRRVRARGHDIRRGRPAEQRVRRRGNRRSERHEGNQTAGLRGGLARRDVLERAGEWSKIDVNVPTDALQIPRTPVQQTQNFRGNSPGAQVASSILMLLDDSRLNDVTGSILAGAIEVHRVLPINFHVPRLMDGVKRVLNTY
jgi:hypothetical protein